MGYYMVAAFELVIIPIDSKLAKHILPGDKIEMELTIHNTCPIQRVKKVFRIMTVDRINELVSCQEIRN